MVAASSRCRESAAFPACVGHEVVAAAYYTELAGQRDCSCWPGKRASLAEVQHMYTTQSPGNVSCYTCDLLVTLLSHSHLSIAMANS